MINTENMTPAQVRELIGKGEITTPTSGMCPGYAQANLVIHPESFSFSGHTGSHRSRHQGSSQDSSWL